MERRALGLRHTGGAYDYNGNTTSKTDSTGTTSYTWDFENRLSSVTLPGRGGTVTFKYDPFGRRIYKSSSSGTSIYAYDIDNLIEETNSSGAVVARYAQHFNIDEPLAMLRSSTTSYYEADGLARLRNIAEQHGWSAGTDLHVRLVWKANRIERFAHKFVPVCWPRV
jgi:YD repeat-containing protein